MEPQKDNKIEPTQNNLSTGFNKNIDHISFFEKDEYFIFVYKKTEKLATATYMVTNLFSDNESLKWVLRKKVSELLSFILGCKNSVPQQTFVDDTKNQILNIISLFEVASKSSLVSVMNFTILQEEFLNLARVLDEVKSTSENSPSKIFPKSFFEISRGSFNFEYGKENIRVANSPTLIKDKKLGENNQFMFKKTNRQNIIIGLLKKGKEMNIKDIAQTIRDCSEKTIQRELISLIESGVITKKGERRWSRYSLAV